MKTLHLIIFIMHSSYVGKLNKSFTFEQIGQYILKLFGRNDPQMYTILRVRYPDLEKYLLKCDNFIKANPKQVGIIELLTFNDNLEEELKTDGLEYIDVRN